MPNTLDERTSSEGPAAVRAPALGTVADRLRQIRAARLAASRPDPHPMESDPLAIETGRELGIKPRHILEVVESHRGIEVTDDTGIVYVIVDPDDPDGAGEYGVMHLFGSTRPQSLSIPTYTPRPDDERRAQRFADQTEDEAAQPVMPPASPGPTASAAAARGTQGDAGDQEGHR